MCVRCFQLGGMSGLGHCKQQDKAGQEPHDFITGFPTR